MEHSSDAPPLLRASMPELDSVRGVAVAVVLAYHSLEWSVGTDHAHGVARALIEATTGGWLGVQLFFVLSGFLITGILVDTRERPDYYKRFYKRRALRILPAYLALLALLGALGMISGAFALVSLLFVSNLSSMFGVAMQYGPLWSLAVEEQFYLLWPFASRRLKPMTLAGLAAAIVLLTPLLRYAAFLRWGPDPLYGETWFVWDGIALGALLAIWLRSANVTRRRATIAAASLTTIGAVGLAIGLPFGILHRVTPVGAAFQLAPWHFLFAGMILTTLLVGTSRWRALVLPRSLRYLGRVSYGLYLIHALVIVKFDVLMMRFAPSAQAWMKTTPIGLLTRLAIIASISVGIAAVSREYFEERFLRRKDRASAPAQPAAPAAVETAETVPGIA